MAIKIQTFAGFNISGTGDWFATFTRGANVHGRSARVEEITVPGFFPRIGRIDRQARKIAITLVFGGGGNLEAAVETLKRQFEVGKEGDLVVNFDVGAGGVARKLAVTIDAVRPYRRAPGQFEVIGRAVDPVWRSNSDQQIVNNYVASGTSINVPNDGNADEFRSTLTVRPLTAKVQADAHTLMTEVLVTNEVFRPANNWALCITGDGRTAFWDHLTEVGAGDSLAAGFDVRVIVDGLDSPRYVPSSGVNAFNTALTKIWIPISFSAARKTTLVGAITAASPADGAGLVVFSTVGFPEKGTVRVNDEAIEYDGLSVDGSQFLDIVRGARNTTAAIANDTDGVTWVEHRIQIVYGHTGAVVADVNNPTIFEPLIDFTLSTNTQHRWAQFGDTAFPGRPMEWARDLSTRDTLAALMTEPSASPDNVMDWIFSVSGAKANQPNFNTWVREVPFGTGSDGTSAHQIRPDGFSDIFSVDSIARKYEDPEDVVTATTGARDIAWSPDSRFVAVATDTTPFVEVYTWSMVDGFGTKFDDPTPTLPAGVANSVHWSNDGLFLAVGHDTTPFITVYAFDSSGFGAKVADAAALAASDVNDVKFSPDDLTIAACSDSTPFIHAWPWSGTFGAKVANPATLPGGQGNGLAWTAASDFVGIANNGTPFINVYPYTTVFGAAVANPGTLPPGDCNDIHFMANDSEVIVGSDTTPFVRGYPWTGTFGTVRADPTGSEIPDDQVNGIEFGPGSGLSSPANAGPVASAINTTKFINFNVYRTGWSGRHSEPDDNLPPLDLPDGQANRVRYSPTGQALGVAHNGGEFVTVYRWRGQSATIRTGSIDATMGLIASGIDSQGAEQALSAWLGPLSDTNIEIDEASDPLFTWIFYGRSAVTNELPDHSNFADNNLGFLSTTLTDTWQSFVAHGDGIVNALTAVVAQDDTTTRTYTAGLFFDSTGNGIPDTDLGLTFLNTVTKSTAAEELVQFDLDVPIILQDGLTYYMVMDADATGNNPRWDRKRTPYKEGASGLSGAPTPAFTFVFNILSLNLEFQDGARADDGASMGFDDVTLFYDSVDGVPYVAQQAEQAVYHLVGDLQNTDLTQRADLDMWVQLADDIEIDVDLRTVKNLTQNENALHLIIFSDPEEWFTFQNSVGLNSMQWTEVGVVSTRWTFDYADTWQ